MSFEEAPPMVRAIDANVLAFCAGAGLYWERIQRTPHATEIGWRICRLGEFLASASLVVEATEPGKFDWAHLRRHGANDVEVGGWKFCGVQVLAYGKHSIEKARGALQEDLQAVFAELGEWTFSNILSRGVKYKMQESGPSVLNELIENIPLENKYLRALRIRGLGRFRTSGAAAIDPLCRIVESEEDVFIRGHALLALGGVGNTSTLAFLSKFKSNGNSYLSEMASLACDVISDPRWHERFGQAGPSGETTYRFGCNRTL